MEKIIYVKLLEEGTEVYKPVPAIQLEKNVYEIKGQDIYDPSDEVWEFLPSTKVFVEERKLGENLVLIAVREKIN